MKKVKLALLVATGLLATSAQSYQGWQGNWLLGVSAGGAWHNNDDDATVTISRGGVAPVAVAFNVDNNNDGSNFIWGLLAGYQARCNGWLLGAEVNVDWRGNNNDDNNFTFVTAAPLAVGTVVGSVSRDRDFVVGLTGRLGYEVSPYFMPYIRLGVDHSNADFDAAFATVAPAAPLAVSFNNNDNNNNWGFVGGIGAEFPVPVIAGLSLRAEWNYHTRGNNDNDIVALASDNITLFSISGGDRHEQTARASLVFNFPG